MFPKDLDFKLIQAIHKQKYALEIECRVRHKNITREMFMGIVSAIEKSKDGYTKSHSHTIDYYQKAKRISEINGEYYNTSKTPIIESIIIKKDDNLSLKISVAREKISKSRKPATYDFSREKSRTTFTKDDNMQIDLTEVIENDEKKYEVEIEVIDSSRFNYRLFTDKIQFVVSLFENKEDIIKSFFNSALGSNRGSSHLDYGSVSRARDLHFKDITNDGLLQHYTVSSKADGIQQFLAFHETGVWLLYPVKKGSSKPDVYFICDLEGDWVVFKDSLFAGEVLDTKKIKSKEYSFAKNVFLPFDTIKYKGKIVRRESYLKRREFLTHIYDIEFCKPKTNVIVKEKKVFVYDPTPKDFHEKVMACFDSQKDLFYETDGVMFTPINSPYVASGQNYGIDPRNRVLNKHPDVCKYKLPEDLTIDFKVKDGRLFAGTEEFKGTRKYPFTSKNYRIPEETSYEDKIVEFEPIYNSKEHIVLVPRKIRDDKTASNKLSFAEDIWSLQHDPIYPGALTGKNTQMLRKYNSSVKSTMIFGMSGYVVDIGSGKGGDISKYVQNKKITKILAIEPNEEFVEEFKSRLQKQSSRDKEKFKLVVAGGEDTSKIAENMESFFPEDMSGEDMNINFMISLSFFWKTKTMLDKLGQTVGKIKDIYMKRGGKQIQINYFTIVGNRLLKLFEERGNEIFLNTIILKKSSKNEVFVDIDDGNTVTNQTEYIVNLEDFWKKIKFYPEIEKTPLAEKPSDFILSENEKVYNSLFVYGKAVPREDIEPVEEGGLDRLPVDVKAGVYFDAGVAAKGDDAVEKMNTNNDLYRVATINLDKSLYHSILKLIDPQYQEKDFFYRMDKVKEISPSWDDISLEDLSLQIHKNIKVISHKNPVLVNTEQETWIILHQCHDGSYEPVVSIEGEEMYYEFKNGSSLI